MRDCALAWGPGKGRVPAWLQKWVSLCLAYVELEQTLLPAQLLAIPPPLGNFTTETAASQAKGMVLICAIALSVALFQVQKQHHSSYSTILKDTSDNCDLTGGLWGKCCQR